MGIELTRLQKRNRELMQENIDLRTKMSNWHQQSVRDTDAAVRAAVAPFRNKVADLKSQVIASDKKAKQAVDARARAEAEAATLRGKVQELEARVAAPATPPGGGSGHGPQ